MTKATVEQAGRYVLAGSDEHLRRRSCWQYGAAAVFDPVRWRDAVVKVRRECYALVTVRVP